MFFGVKVTSAPMSGVLLADGVGVGKTAQVMVMIAFLQQLVLIEQVQALREKLNHPPIIWNMPWFMGVMENVPDEPHLIIVPLSLVGQWKDELYRFFSRGTIDIFQLPSLLEDVKEFFSDPDGSWLQSQQKMINRVVICAHSMMTAQVFNMKKARGAFVDSEHTVLSEDTEKLVFSLQWCTMWIDKAHLFHGPGHGLTGACQLHKCARVTHVITATPLFTKIQDIINMGRMCNHDEFVLSKGQLLERHFNRKIRAAKRDMTEPEKAAVKSRNLRALRGDEVDEDDAGIAVRFAQYNVAKVVQGKLVPYLIRRTLTSVDFDRIPLNSKMPPITEHMLTIKLSDREMENLGLLVDEMESSESGVPTNLSLENFFLPYRCGITMFKVSDEDWPIFDMTGNLKLGHYNDISSTKLDLVARLMLHLLSHDHIEHPTMVNGEVVFPSPPPLVFSQQAPQKRKILVYHEFSMMAMTIQTVFRMKGISVLVLNGLLTKEQQERVIKDFVNSDAQEHWVLLFLSIGAVGLNLTCVDTVIMLDTIWSQVGTEQIIGRSAHLTQENAVHVYHLVSLRTTDVLMSTMAREKGEMLRTLFSKEKNEKLEQVFYGRTKKGTVPDSDPEEDDNDSGKKKKTKPLPRAYNVALKSISRSETSSTSRASKTAAEETAEEPEVADDEGEGVDGGDGGEEKMAEEGKGKGKEKVRTKAPAKPKPAAKTKLKPRAKGKGKSAAEVNEEAPGPSKKPTGERATTSEADVNTPLGIMSEHIAGAAGLPTDETGSMDMDQPAGKQTPSQQPMVLMGPGNPGAGQPAQQPAAQPAAKTRPKPRAKGKGKGAAEVSQEAAGPSKKPTGERATTSEADVDMPLGIVSEHIVSTARLPTEETGSADVDKPAGAGPSLGPQRTQPEGSIATQRESQSQLQMESMEIDNELQQASPPPMGTSDSPMDVDALADEDPKVRTRSTKSKGSKTKSSKAFDPSPAAAAPGLTRPPWTQANPTTPPKAGRKNKPQGSPNKSPRTELRQRKTPRNTSGRGGGSRGLHRVPESELEEDDGVDIAAIKQEGEPP
ncbi:hypothetical protein BDN71DRAFT_1594410 [Pleurotus eryngii]|uniref:Helicase C-terminal domain-containing protein n=1 Tax=Pleurotus eryngii TaxID=5323 RepID=A0A9P6D1M6_PLEER|nr:hypothetical protein BDN71DRAFT_1594410 [Pleurotus eryngii]